MKNDSSDTAKAVSAEKNTGLHSFFRLVSVYTLFQRFVSRTDSRHWVIQHHFRPRSGDRIVDVGCGPGALVGALPPNCEVFGFDPNVNYIAAAQRSHRGTFLVGDMKEFLRQHGEILQNSIDLVVCSGVLHHLSPVEICDVLSGATHLLRPGGRFVAIEPAFLEKQDLLSRLVMKQDRGQSIFMDHQWTAIMREHFPEIEVKVLNNLLRIPYIHVLLAGVKA